MNSLEKKPKDLVVGFGAKNAALPITTNYGTWQIGAKLKSRLVKMALGKTAGWMMLKQSLMMLNDCEALPTDPTSQK
jgi:hypothetical protein